MEKYYDLSKMTSEEIATDFLAEEAEGFDTLEEAKRRAEQLLNENDEDGDWHALGIFDGYEFFCTDKYDDLIDEWLSTCE